MKLYLCFCAALLAGCAVEPTHPLSTSGASEVGQGHVKIERSGSSRDQLVIPHDLRQVLMRKKRKFTAVPVAQVAQTGATSTVIQVVTRGDQLKERGTLAHVRAAYGGIYPYVVVHSQSPFVVVSQEGDILVVGIESPERVVFTPAPPSTLVRARDGTFVAQPTAAPNLQVFQVVGRVDADVTLPPGVPKDLLRKEDFTGTGSRLEPTWALNHRIAFEVTSQFAVVGAENGRVRVFQVEVK